MVGTGVRVGAAVAVGWAVAVVVGVGSGFWVKVAAAVLEAASVGARTGPVGFAWQALNIPADNPTAINQLRATPRL